MDTVRLLVCIFLCYCEVHVLPFLNEPFGTRIRCQVYLEKDLEI